MDVAENEVISADHVVVTLPHVYTIYGYAISLMELKLIRPGLCPVS